MVGSLRERLAGNRRLHCNRQPGCRRTSGELHHQPSRTAYPLSFDGTNSKTWFTARTYFYQISIQPDLPRYQHQNQNRQGHPSVTPASIMQPLMTRRNNSSLALLITGGRQMVPQVAARLVRTLDHWKIYQPVLKKQMRGWGWKLSDRHELTGCRHQGGACYGCLFLPTNC